MESINMWIRNIVFILLVSSFVEMLMPEGTYKKYCRLVFGLMIIVIMIKPIATWSGNDNLLEKTYFETSNNISKSNIIDNSKYISDKQKILVIDTYQKKLEKDIKDRIQGLGEEYSTEISIDMDKNLESSGFGSIRQIHVLLKDKHKVIYVEPIIINTSKEKEVYSSDKNNQIDKETADKIKDEVNTIYGIPKENISINTYEKRE